MSGYSQSRFSQTESCCVGTTLVLILGIGCSTQDFSYLQSGAGVSTGGTPSKASTSSPGEHTSAAGGSTFSGGTTSQAGGVGGVGGATIGSGGITGAGGSTMSTGGATANTGGITATGGATTSPPCVGDPNVIGSATRPQLTSAAAATYTIPQYLASAGTIGSLVEDDWNPTGGLGDATQFTPIYTVAADGSGTHTSIQAALADVLSDTTDAGAADDTSRIYILVKPGTYREVVCVNVHRPITLYGTGADASAVQIVFGNNAGKTADDAGINPCTTPANDLYGPAGSATFAAASNEVQLKNLTIANDFQEGSNPWASGLQAVALMTSGDRIVLDNVRLVGNLYTALFDSPDPTVVSRVYVKNSYIAGDMQYITGRATLVIDNSEIHYLTSRLDTSLGSTMAASTAGQNPYGMLVINTRFTIDTTTNSNWVLLGRSWDQGVTTYDAGASTNGQIVVRDSWMDSHIKKTLPWGNALESSRQYDCLGNRLYEYANTGPGAAQ
jgi:pectinesterase